MTTLDHMHKTGLVISDLQELIKYSEPNSISVYLPTHRTGDEVLHRRDAKTLDGFIRSIKASLIENGLVVTDVDKRLAALTALVRDEVFWRQRTEGLALFSNESMLVTADLPYGVQPEVHIAETFYLPPLAPLLSGCGGYYVLALELKRIRLFKANREAFVEMPIANLIPDRLEERVGYDYEQKSLQHRTQQRQQGGSSSHGHDEADRDRKNEILRYFRAVDKGLQPVLSKDPLPLMIASQTYLAALYREASTYDLLVEEHVAVNLSEAPDEALHRESWKLIAWTFDKTRREKWAKFEELHGTGKASAQLSRIIPAAFDGKIDSLFISEDAQARGIYDPESRSLTLSDASEDSGESLLNLAMRETLRNGGSVFVGSPEKMSGESREMAALFRY
jgi:hypothetical protein